MFERINSCCHLHSTLREIFGTTSCFLRPRLTETVKIQSSYKGALLGRVTNYTFHNTTTN